MNSENPTTQSQNLRWSSRINSLGTNSVISTVENLLKDFDSSKDIWRGPTIHRDDSVSVASTATSMGGAVLSVSSHRIITWYELCYDLIIVASAVQIGNLIRADYSFPSILQVCLQFLLIRASWDSVVSYQNVFDADDFVHLAFYILQALAAFSMSIHLSSAKSTVCYNTPWDSRIFMIPFSATGAFSRLLMVVMYIPIYMRVKRYSFHVLVIMLTKAVSGFFLILACFTDYSTEAFKYLWFFSILIERPLVVFGLFRRCCCTPESSRRVPIHLAHMFERQGTFIMLVLGEAIIQLVQNQTGYSYWELIRSFMGFALIFSIGDLYFHGQRTALTCDSKVREQYVGHLWTGLHVLLSLSIMLFACSLKLVYQAEEQVNSDKSYFLTLSTGFSLVFIFILRMVHKGIFVNIGQKTRFLSYLFRFFMSFLCCLVPLMTSDSTMVIALLFSFVLILLLHDTIIYRGKILEVGPRDDESLVDSMAQPF